MQWCLGWFYKTHAQCLDNQIYLSTVHCQQISRRSHLDKVVPTMNEVPGSSSRCSSTAASSSSSAACYSYAVIANGKQWIPVMCTACCSIVNSRNEFFCE